MLIYGSGCISFLLSDLLFVEYSVMEQSNSLVSRYLYFLYNTGLLISEVQEMKKSFSYKRQFHHLHIEMSLTWTSLCFAVIQTHYYAYFPTVFSTHIFCFTIKSLLSVCWTKNTMVLKLFYQVLFLNYDLKQLN